MLGINILTNVPLRDILLMRLVGKPPTYATYSYIQSLILTISGRT